MPRSRADIVLELWQKFTFLTAMSSVTAAMRSTIGPIRANPLTRAFALDIMREVVAVGRAHGVALDADFAEKRIGGVDALSPEMQASMALDLQQGRPLELPWLAGGVVDLGAPEGRADALLPRGAGHSGALCGREAGVARVQFS